MSFAVIKLFLALSVNVGHSYYRAHVRPRSLSFWRKLPILPNGLPSALPLKNEKFRDHCTLVYSAYGICPSLILALIRIHKSHCNDESLCLAGSFTKLLHEETPCNDWES